MAIKVTKDGLTLQRHRGTVQVAGRDQPVTISEVVSAGLELRDDQVADHLLERLKNGESVTGLEYTPDGEEGSEEEAAPTTPAEAPAPPPDGQYDPTTHNVEEVLSYLESADADEVKRVQEAEAASNRKSKQVAEFEAKPAS